MKYIKLVISNPDGTAPITYREGEFYSLATTRRIFQNAPSVGNCCCGELVAVLNIPSSAIPKNAKIVPYVSEDESTWTKKSEFFVFQRGEDHATGSLTVYAYDAIFKAEESFTKPGDQGQWPRTDLAVMQEISQRTATAINAASLAALNKAYEVQYPGMILENGTLKPDGKGALTMREVAGRIAAMYGGNWIINNAGEWQLIKLGDIPADTNYLVTEDGDAITLGGVRILV